MASVRKAEDEIETFKDMRTIEPSEVVWRIHEFPLHKRYPSCQSLDIHLHQQQQVYFDKEDDMVELMSQRPKMTQLDAFYKINTEEPNGPNINLTYAEFPSKYVWLQSRQWKLRARQPISIKTEVVGRLPMLQPTHGDVFYLKFLLTQEHSKGK